MSQNENNLFSAYKRSRESLLPQPSSALRRSTLAPPAVSASTQMPPPRMSMAPSRMSAAPNNYRVSSFGTPADPPPSALKSARKSFAPGAIGYGSGIATSSQQSSSQQQQQQQQQQQSGGAPSSVRRSSSYARTPGSQGTAGMGFLSNNAVISQGIVRDPRPLRDKQYLAGIANEILEYLAMNNFEAETKYSVSANFLKSPTQKDFNMVFEFLYHKLDPNYHFTKPMDQEVLPILKTLRYPFSSAITKSALAAVGGANSWPTFLAMLHWLLELVRTMRLLTEGVYEEYVEEATGMDLGTDRIVFDFSAQSYQAWLQGVDEHEEYITEMISQFDARLVKLTSNIKTLTSENEVLAEKLNSINHVNEEGKTPLEVLEGEKEILEKDKEKFIAYITDLQKRITNTTAANQRLREKLTELDAELAQLEEEKLSLQKAVDRQGLSPVDIDRMAGEREKLDKGLMQTAARIDDLKIKSAEKEHDAMRKIEALERAVNRYTSLAYQIGIIPSSSVNAGGRDYEIVLYPNNSNLNKNKSGGGDKMDLDEDGGGMQGGTEDSRLLYDPVTGYQPQMLVNKDLRHDIKPSLNKLRQEIGERIHTLQEEGFKVKELIDRANEAFGDLQEVLDTIQARVIAAQEELDGIKETTAAETNSSNTEIEKLERELQSLRLGMNSGVLSVEQRLQSVTIEWDQYQHTADLRRQELHGEVERALNEVIKFKVHIQEGLCEFEQRLEDEVKVATRVGFDDGVRDESGGGRDTDGDVSMDMIE